MLRRADWPERLSAFIAAEPGFQWGLCDCCLWACSGIEAMTGDDPAYLFRGLYDDEQGARDLLQRFSGGGLVETARLLARIHDKAEVTPLQAQRGDLLVYEGDGMEAAALCVGRRAVALTIEGKRFLPLRPALAAFRI